MWNVFYLTKILGNGSLDDENKTAFEAWPGYFRYTCAVYGGKLVDFCSWTRVMQLPRLWSAIQFLPRQLSAAFAEPANQSAVVTLEIPIMRWRCRHLECSHTTFVEQLTQLAVPFVRRTRRVSELVRLLGHTTGGKPAVRLLASLGMPMSDDTVLKHLKRCAATASPPPPVRVAGIDDLGRVKGDIYENIIVDLERQTVVDIPPDRSADSTAEWFKRHPEVENVSRDRYGIYAQGAKQGAPQAQEVADRFHLLLNLKLTIERQLSRSSLLVGLPTALYPGGAPSG
jgi:hypothetical protein